MCQAKEGNIIILNDKKYIERRVISGYGIDDCSCCALFEEGCSSIIYSCVKGIDEFYYLEEIKCVCTHCTCT